MKKYSNQLAFIALTLLPIIIVGLGSLWGTQNLLASIADSVNRQENSRTAQAVNAAFTSLQRQMHGLMVDNAAWDDAVKNVYGSPDEVWISETWGYSTAESNYDTSFVIDGEGRTLAAFQNGEKVTFTPESYFANNYANLFRRMGQNNFERMEISSLIRLRQTGAIALIGLGRILPYDGKTPAPTARPATLVFSKVVSAELLAKIAQEYNIDQLTLVSDGTAAPADVILHALDGTRVAAAKWVPRDPGRDARDSNIYVAFSIVAGLVALLVPISLAHLRLHRQLQDQAEQSRTTARRDVLSGLPNRVQFLEALAGHMTSKNPKPLTLLFIDLDGFKAVNDSFDHATGDALIRKFGQGLLGLTLPNELVARLGGDEFAVVLISEGASTRAEVLARLIIHFAQQPFELDNCVASIGASVGIADWSDDISDHMEIMRRADLAMYQAKEGGRNTWRRYTPEIDKDRTDDLVIASDLRQYIEGEVIGIAYQPIVNSKSLTITGVEALARWPGPENHGPLRFIRVAEENGLIDRYFRAFLKRAMTDMRPHEGLRLSVNVSALQINNPRLVSDIVEQSRTTGFPLYRLELEFTETHLIKSPKLAKALFDQLQVLGVRVGLDDFGTGFASLGYLRDYSFNTIKLDRSLTQGIFDGDASQKFVQGTITIARGLAAELVAEGVESAEQASFMNLLGCQNLQGYYFFKPMKLVELREVLAPPAMIDRKA
jgi:diguanylate cyclase (GGDEF)-like protein